MSDRKPGDSNDRDPSVGKSGLERTRTEGSTSTITLHATPQEDVAESAPGLRDSQSLAFAGDSPPPRSPVDKRALTSVSPVVVQASNPFLNSPPRRVASPVSHIPTSVTQASLGRGRPNQVPLHQRNPSTLSTRGAEASEYSPSKTLQPPSATHRLSSIQGPSTSSQHYAQASNSTNAPLTESENLVTSADELTDGTEPLRPVASRSASTSRAKTLGVRLPPSRTTSKARRVVSLSRKESSSEDEDGGILSDSGMNAMGPHGMPRMNPLLIEKSKEDDDEVERTDRGEALVRRRMRERKKERKVSLLVTYHWICIKYKVLIRKRKNVKSNGRKRKLNVKGNVKPVALPRFQRRLHHLQLPTHETVLILEYRIPTRDSMAIPTSCQPPL